MLKSLTTITLSTSIIFSELLIKDLRKVYIFVFLNSSFYSSKDHFTTMPHRKQLLEGISKKIEKREVKITLG